MIFCLKSVWIEHYLAPPTRAELKYWYGPPASGGASCRGRRWAGARTPRRAAGQGSQALGADHSPQQGHVTSWDSGLHRQQHSFCIKFMQQPPASPPLLLAPDGVCGHTTNHTKWRLQVKINPDKTAFQPRSLSWLSSLCSCINVYANTAQEWAGTDNVVTVLCCRKATYELPPPPPSSLP